MAPKIPNLTEGDSNSNKDSKSSIPKAPPALQSPDESEGQGLLLEERGHAGEISLARQAALCAGLAASDGGLVFMQLLMLPTLQTLGVPVSSVTLPGCLSGLLCLVGLPLLGYLSDGGSGPQGRKKPAVAVSALVFIAGFSLVISGCALHTWMGPRGGGAGGKIPTPTTLAPGLDFPHNSTGGLFQGSPNLPTALSSAGSFPEDAPSATATVRDVYAGEPQVFEKTVTRAAPAGDRRPFPTDGMSPPQRDPEEKRKKEEGEDSFPSWMSDPLGLAIPFVGVLGIVGFAFIDMGNDLSNSSQKSFVLASTLPGQHVSLLVVGVQFSALGGCVAAALGVSDLAATLVHGTLLDTVPGKTLVQCGFFIGLTLLCVLTTILSAPSPFTHDVKPTPADVTSAQRPDYGTAPRDKAEKKVTPSTSAAVLLESGAVSWADRSLQTSNRHLDRHSHRFPPDSFRFSRRDNSVSDLDSESSCEWERSLDRSCLLNDNSVRRGNSFRLSLQHSGAGGTDHETKAKLFASNSVVYYAIEKDESTSSDSDCEGGLSGSRMEEDGSSSSSLCHRLKSRPTRRLALICLSMFFMCGAWQSFNVCATDYLGKVIYCGDPDADPESQSYAAYQQGLRSGSLGVLILNGIYVVVNFMQRRLLTTAGPKVECLVVCGLLLGCLITLLATDNIAAYYVTSTVFGIFRSAMYTIPFMLANEICQEEARSRGAGKGQANVGRTMALVTTMVSLSNLLVSSMTGPLLSSSRGPASPLYYTIAATFVAALIFVFT
ncbi:hypothetical protein ACOMHN_010154 [Nucella lapillus]